MVFCAIVLTFLINKVYGFFFFFFFLSTFSNFHRLDLCNNTFVAVANTSRKHGKKEPQSFDHPDLQSLNDCKCFFFVLTEWSFREFGAFYILLERFILENFLCSTIQKYNLNPSRLIFQHDNDPNHMSKIMRKWLTSQLFQLLQWLAQSQDLNPIEHF